MKIRKWMKRTPLFGSLLISGFVLAAAGWAVDAETLPQENGTLFAEPFVARLFRNLHDDGWQKLGEIRSGEAEEEQTVFAAGQSGEDAVYGRPGDGEGDGPQNGGAQSGDDGAQGVNSNTPTETGSTAQEGQEESSYAFSEVTEAYFEDALFIGDSRTVGLYKYAGMEEQADFFCKTSLTIWDVLDKPFVRLEGESRPVTVEEALTRKVYGKIYLMVGINELGRGNTDLFMEQYETVVERIRQLQPDAILFVEGIMRVAGEKSAEDAVFNNVNINERNDRIALLADNKNIFYIDVNEAVCDENGDLIADYTFDQIHLKAVYYEEWKKFLLAHGIVREQDGSADSSDGGKADAENGV